VLEIRVPDPGPIHSEHDLWTGLVGLAPRIVTYLMSFLTLGIFWGGQRTQLGYLARSDRHFSWIQLAFLAMIAMMPFSTSLLAEFIAFRIALLLYWANIALIGIVLYASWRYATSAGLVKEGTPPEVSPAIVRRIAIGQSLYAFGALLCVFSTYWSIAFIVAVQLNYAIAPRVPVLSRL